jgi:hypothetical protein
VVREPAAELAADAADERALRARVTEVTAEDVRRKLALPGVLAAGQIAQVVRRHPGADRQLAQGVGAGGQVAVTDADGEAGVGRPEAHGLGAYHLVGRDVLPDPLDHAAGGGRALVDLALQDRGVAVDRGRRAKNGGDRGSGGGGNGADCVHWMLSFGCRRGVIASSMSNVLRHLWRTVNSFLTLFFCSMPEVYLRHCRRTIPVATLISLS